MTIQMVHNGCESLDLAEDLQMAEWLKNESRLARALLFVFAAYTTHRRHCETTTPRTLVDDDFIGWQAWDKLETLPDDALVQVRFDNREVSTPRKVVDVRHWGRPSNLIYQKAVAFRPYAQ